MSQKTFLLCIDGSKQSLDAAEAAWSLAESIKARVVCQTVVDTQAIWNFVGRETAGLIGSGPYMAAHEAVKTALLGVGEALLSAYDARALAHTVDSECLLIEGCLTDEIAKNSKNYSLVVMGHRSKHERLQHSKRDIDYGISGQVMEFCEVPLLLVGERVHPCKSVRLIISPDSFTQLSLDWLLELTAALKTPGEIYCLESGPQTDEFVLEVKEWVAHRDDVTVLRRSYDDCDDSWDCAMDAGNDSFLIVTSTNMDGHRLTCGGTDARSLVDSMNRPSLMFIPPQERKERLIGREMARRTSADIPSA